MIMGANQSTRKITVVNDEASGVIKISDSVVQRLKGEISGKPEAARPTPPPVEAPPPPEPLAPPPPPVVAPPPPVVEPPPPPVIEAPPPPPVVEPPPPPPVIELPPVVEAPPPPPVVVAPPPPVAVAPPAPEQSAPSAWQRPIIQYIEEPSLSALKVRQEKELELLKLEEYWKDRLRKQQEDSNHMQNINQEEFNKSVEKVGKLFKKSGSSQICRDERQAVMECYGNNPGQALNCRETVRSFAACVNDQRLKNLHPGG